MEVSNKKIWGIFGYSVQHPDLENATVLSVTRSGMGYEETTGTPDGQQFRYHASEGRIEFDPDVPFVITVTPVLGGGFSHRNYENIQVLYKK